MERPQGVEVVSIVAYDQKIGARTIGFTILLALSYCFCRMRLLTRPFCARNFAASERLPYQLFRLAFFGFGTFLHLWVREFDGLHRASLEDSVSLLFRSLSFKAGGALGGGTCAAEANHIR
jgi:hypothetical protein